MIFMVYWKLWFMMRLTPFAAVWLNGIVAMVSAQSAPVQVGDMACILDTSTGIMKATMAIYKKTSIVTRAYFTKQSSYDVVYDGTGCQWTGTGTESDPFIGHVEVDSSTNLPPSGKNGCGYEIIDAEEQVYKWTVYNQIQNELGREGDVIFTFECSGKGTPTSISVEVTFNVKDYEGEAVRIRPENRMSVLERPQSSSNFGQVVTDSVAVNQQIKLRVESKVKVNSLRQAGIDHYGVYVFFCDYRTTVNGNPTLFIEQNGCANNVFSKLLGTGFKYAQFSTQNAVNEHWFQTETDAFILVPFTPTINTYYIRCYVGYCYGTEGVDARCGDYCGTNARSRRSLSNTTTYDSISIQVKVNNEQYYESENEKQTGLGSQTVIIVTATIVGVLLAAIIAAIVVFCCFRRRQRRHSEKEWTDTSTTNSRGHLSFYTTAHQDRYPKF